jgi:excisionase family DNA binding protein
MPENLISPQGLAELCDVPLPTIYKWNHEGTGPKVLHIGRHVRYRPEDVEIWLKAREVRQPDRGEPQEVSVRRGLNSEPQEVTVRRQPKRRSDSKSPP